MDNPQDANSPGRLAMCDTHTARNLGHNALVNCHTKKVVVVPRERSVRIGPCLGPLLSISDEGVEF